MSGKKGEMTDAILQDRAHFTLHKVKHLARSRASLKILQDLPISCKILQDLMQNLVCNCTKTLLSSKDLHTLWLTLDHHTSSNWTMIFMVHSLKFKRKLEIHKALQYLGGVYLTDGDHQTAFSLFTVALEGFTNMDVHCSRAECMLHLGDILKLRGELHQAVELWTTARPLFERSSQAKQAGHIDERLARTSIHRKIIPSPRFSIFSS
ncbi:hypothetical protein FB451DRAFT_1170601 [Mycena latifolia]|nr:hypothetical protein FB451DRAFT_1170601 [Mycena latifolia]